MGNVYFHTDSKKRINYQMEISETGKPDVALSSYSAPTPFMPIQVGEKVNLFGLPNTSRDEYWKGKKLKVERIEHGFFENKNTITQKILVSGKIVSVRGKKDGQHKH
ncbi:MAG: hypothetical protein H7839_08560 [Magnetococcus sp. YQC-5]